MKISKARIKEIIREELIEVQDVPSYSTVLSEQVSGIIEELMNFASKLEVPEYEKVHEIITKLKPIRDELVKPQYKT